jgi:hypothetical protein
MLDGVFERRNNFLYVWRQLAPALDVWPQRDRWERTKVRFNLIASRSSWRYWRRPQSRVSHDRRTPGGSLSSDRSV